MRHEIQHSNTSGRSDVQIVVYLKDQSEESRKNCEQAIRAALPNVSYSLMPAMVGSDGMPEDEYNILGTYVITHSTKPEDARYPDRHPGNSEIEIKVRVFSGHHSTIEETVAEYQRQGNLRTIDLGAALTSLNLSALAAAEHIVNYRKDVLGIND